MARDSVDEILNLSILRVVSSCPADGDETDRQTDADIRQQGEVDRTVAEQPESDGKSESQR